MSPSLGMMKFPIDGKIKVMFQTTSQIYVVLLKYETNMVNSHKQTQFHVPAVVFNLSAMSSADLD